jgi:stage III sporulation protein SpoIIIAA
MAPRHRIAEERVDPILVREYRARWQAVAAIEEAEQRRGAGHVEQIRHEPRNFIARDKHVPP